MWACDLIVAAEGTRFADVVGTRLWSSTFARRSPWRTTPT